MQNRLLFVCFIWLGIAGCHYQAPVNSPYQAMQDSLQHGSAIDRAIAARSANIPGDVRNSLIPKEAVYTTQTKQHLGAKRFNISVKDIPAKTFFLGLVKGTPYSVVIDPKVSGSISLDLKNVTLNDVLNIVQHTYGYQYTKTANGIEVGPAGLQTRIFNVNYLNMSRTGKTQTSVSSGQPTDIGSTGNELSQNFAVNGNNEQAVVKSSDIETKSSSDFWKALKVTLSGIIGKGDGRNVISDPGAGIVVVKAFPEGMREVSDYLHAVQENVDRQVIIEAKILEIRLTNGFQSGIDWKLLGFHQGVAASQDTFNNNVLTVAGQLNHTFSAVIKMLSSQGNVQVISSPRISTLNNQKAVIKVGNDEYFVTGLTNSTLASGGGTDSSEDIQLTPFFSGIALDVTPEINQNKDVILHIHPSISKVTQTNKTINTGANNPVILPTAASSIREADSIVRAKSGQVIVIGGLMENALSENLNSTPFAGDIPFLGAAFRDTNQLSNKTELVILLRPIIVNPSTWHRHLDKLAERYRQLNRGFHFGNHTDTFGNLGETRPEWLPQY